MSHVEKAGQNKPHHHPEIRDLEQLRGEFALELHLMNMEMKTRWRALEKKFEDLRNDARLQTGTAARRYVEELKADYKKLREELRDAF